MNELYVSIVIPTYNGSKTISKLVHQLIDIMASKKIQIILVNDGSIDNNNEICLKLQKEYPAIITYINLSKNFGEHNAVMAGLNYVYGDYAVIMDDDFQNPPQEVSRLIEEASTKGYDIVYSYYDRKQHSFLRNLGSKANNWFANFVLGKPHDLYLSSFKCLSKFVVDEIVKYKGPFPYIDGLALRCTRNIGKIKCDHNKRIEGHSGYTFKKLIALWMTMFINFSTNPLRLISLLGFFCSCFGLLLGILVLIEKMYYPEVSLGWPSLMIAIIFFAGIQLFILGFIGEYIGRLFMSHNQAPQFIIKEIYSAKTHE